MNKKEFNSGIAFEEQVFERALEILAEKGIETDLNQMQRVYKYSSIYTKKVLEEKDYCAVYLGELGRAYYHLYDITKKKQYFKDLVKYNKEITEKGKERAAKNAKVWQEKYNHISDEYEKRRTGINVAKTNMLFHIIQNLRRAIKRRKYTPEEVEEIQNSIK